MPLAAQSFDGHTVNVAFEFWRITDGSQVDLIINEKDVVASDTAYPDEKDFYALGGYVNHFEWDIDFNQNVIELTYASIKLDDPYYNWPYTGTRGFHFQDSENSLPAIINVIVDDTFAMCAAI